MAARAHGGHEEPGGSEVALPPPGPLSFAAPRPGSYALPPLGAAADGAVLPAEGPPTTLHALFAHDVVLFSFVYTHCTDARGCPLASAVLQQVARRLADEPDTAARVRMVTLSFDPDRDTPEVMRRYGAALAVAGVRWTFATTESPARLAPILDAYGQTLRRETDAEGRPLGTFSHILRVFLIDGAGRIRNIYTASFLEPETLLSDVKTLLLEAPQRGPAGAGAGHQPAPAAAIGPGDVRDGYERTSYRTRSRDLAARRGAPADLLARLRQPPLGLPAVPVPTDNLPTPEKVALGRKLFYDRRLSLNGTISCAMCHVPEQGFTQNEQATPIGIEGRTVRRNAPTLFDVAYLPALFHDGRETRLEYQIWGPLLAKNEMGNPAIGVVLERLRGLPDYAGRFEAAFPERGLGLETVGMAIASYERTLLSGDSPFDRWRYGGDEAALPEDASRGFALFTGRAGCAACHLVGDRDALLTDGAFHDTGIGYTASRPGPGGNGGRPAGRRILVAPGVYLTPDPAVVAQVSEPPPSDLGRYEVTQDPTDRWKYRTPTLRNVALTAPYMHDGSLATLDDVVAFYDGGGVPHEGLDPRVRPLGLSDRERADLVAFLRSLTGHDVAELVADAFAAPIGNPGGAGDEAAAAAAR